MSQYYKKYMKKREEEKPSYLKLFVGAFLLMIVFFFIMATHLTIGTDTNIGENDEGDIKESGLGVKHLIDSRLRFIQMDDISGGVRSTKDSETTTIQQYDKKIEEDKAEGYNGKLQDSYGYDTTQQTKPYSQTYTNTNNTVKTNVSTPVTVAPKPSVQKPAVQPTPISVPTPSTQTAKPKPSGSPAHNIQKNLAPTGM